MAIGTGRSEGAEILDGRTISFDVAISDKDADDSFSWIAWGKSGGKTGDANRRGDVVFAPSLTDIGRIGGRVEWRRDGKSIPGIQVRVRSVDHPGSWVRQDTGIEGKYALELPIGDYEVSLEFGRGGIPGQHATVRADAEATVDFSVEATHGLRVACGPGTTLPAGGIRNRAWSSFGATDGLGNGFVHALAQDRKGYLWIGTEEGLVRYDGISFTRYTSRDGLVDDGIRALLVDRDGYLWIGTEGGLMRYDGTSFTHYTSRDGLVDDEVLALLEDRQGRLWINTQGGVSRFDGHQFTNLSILSGSDKWNRAWLEDRQGRMWICAQEKLWLYEDDALVLFSDSLVQPGGSRADYYQATKGRPV